MLLYVFTEQWSSQACQKCQVKGQNISITSYAAQSHKSCDDDTETFSLCVSVLNALRSDHHHFFSISTSTQHDSFLLFLPIMFSLCLLVLSFLPLFCCPSLCWSQFLLLSLLYLQTCTRCSLIPVCVAVYWVKVACHYRCRHRPDKGHGHKQQCLWTCSAGVSVHVCGVCDVSSAELIRHEHRRMIASGGSDCTWTLLLLSSLVKLSTVTIYFVCPI